MSTTISLESPEYGTIVWTVPAQHADLADRLKKRAESTRDFEGKVTAEECLTIMARTSLGASARALLLALEDVAGRNVGTAIRTLDVGACRLEKEVKAIVA